MNPEETLKILKELLADPIAWYNDCFKNFLLDPEETPDPDGLTYDESWLHISNIPRGNHQEILRLLSDDNNEG